MIHYIWCGLQVYVDPEVVVVLEFVGGIRQGRIEHSQQAVERRHRNLPYSEEAQNMVDTVGIEVFRHFAEALFPPREAVAVHLLPVIGGEAPGLAEDREVIGRCSGLAVHIEQAGVHPGVDTGTRDAYGYIALNGHAFAVRVVAHMAQLLVEVVLYVTYKVDFGAVLFYKLVEHVLAVGCVFAPEAEVGCAEAVAQHTECRVWQQPGGVALHK